MKSNQLVFCCDMFKHNYCDKEIITDGLVTFEGYPSFRVTKLMKSKYDDEFAHLYRIVIVCGKLYENAPPPFILIRYCPFCGADLNTFYTKPEYVNLKPDLIFK
jgi:hypothetical protein